MAGRTNFTVGSPSFIADFPSIVRSAGGHQIDWPNIVADGTYGVTGARRIPAGTVVGTTLGSGKLRPRVVTTNPAVGILETDAVEDDKSAALSGYGVIRGGHVYENLLPEAAGGPPRVLADAVKTELRAAGGAWIFSQYADVR